MNLTNCQKFDACFFFLLVRAAPAGEGHHGRRGEVPLQHLRPLRQAPRHPRHVVQALGGEPHLQVWPSKIKYKA